MIEKQVKTLYGNLISVQGVYVKRAYTRKQGLKLVHGNQYMIRPPKKLHKPILTKMIPDKFIKNKMNKLYYYQWQPVDEKQNLLWDENITI